MTGAEMVAALKALGLTAAEADSAWVVELPIADELRKALDLEVAPCVAVVEPLQGRWLVTIDTIEELDAEKVIPAVQAEAERMRATLRKALMAQLAALGALEGELKELRRVAWGVVHNAGRLPGLKPRWAHVADVTGLGSTSASKLCRDHDADPDEDVGIQDEVTDG